MDTDRKPAAVLHTEPEVISPVRALGEGTSGTVQPDLSNSPIRNIPRTTTRIDSSNLGPSAATSSENFHDTSSMQLLTQPIRQTSVRLPDLNTERRQTKNEGEIDWIVPKEEEKVGRGLTVGERLQPTLDTAIIEKDKCAAKARWSGIALNAAIGLQVLFGSLTTGLSALSVAGGPSAAKATTAVGALSTLIASYLARARGSNEPELSIARTKDLEQFIRECRTFQMDHGHMIGDGHDKDLVRFRGRYEELLGNGNEERKLSSV